MVMETKSRYGCNNLLELAATDDVDGFRAAVEEKGGRGINDLGLWYVRRIGNKKMGYEERTPLMIAAMYGSTKVVSYMIDSCKADLNRVSGSDMVTALHSAVAGGTVSSPRIVEMLIGAGADADRVDGNGNGAGDLIPRVPNLLGKKIKMSLEGDVAIGDVFAIEGMVKKEYPADTSLPDINTGLYSTDEFRMYSFKIKPCSRAYTHDWTECPFAHPGENARRRDPKKYQYSCVPCPEFKKGACKNGDNCEYAHGVFESWLHPAQYRTRLCRDETACARKVCFFAHKKEELRPVYAATGSALPSPTFSTALSGLDMGVGNQIGQYSTPPMSPTLSPSSPKWQSRVSSPAPPSLQLPGSRLRSSLNARDMDLEIKLLRLKHDINQQQQFQLMEEIYGRTRDFNPTLGEAEMTQMGSQSGFQMHPTFGKNQSLVRGGYSTSQPSSPSPVRKVSPNRLDMSSPMSAAAAMLSSRSAEFAKRSHSFIDRGAVTAPLAFSGSFNGANSVSVGVTDWGSPDGRLDWGIKGEELNKLRKSASFGYRGQNGVKAPSANDEPDVSWVNSLVVDAPSGIEGAWFGPHYGPNNAVQELCSAWRDQLYMEEEQMVA